MNAGAGGGQHHSAGTVEPPTSTAALLPLCVDVVQQTDGMPSASRLTFHRGAEILVGHKEQGFYHSCHHL